MFSRDIEHCFLLADFIPERCSYDGVIGDAIFKPAHDGVVFFVIGDHG